MWQLGEVVETVTETPRTRSLVMTVPSWPHHQPGQHVDVRLTAEDGYQAIRSYSIASPPEAENLELTIEQLPDGEVSPYLTEEVRVGDRLEVRGPIGGYFIWEAGMGGPVLLVAGGSGIVPLMAMIRHRVAVGSDVPIRLLYSARSPEDIIYRAELERLSTTAPGFELIYTYTRSHPPGWTGYQRRVDQEMLREVAWPPLDRALAFTCGPTLFVETVASGLGNLGYGPARIRTERFGPTGG
jgi:ferredoxin-NADP reductase